MWGRGSGQEGGARAWLTLLYVAGQVSRLERCSLVSGVTAVQPDLFAGSEPPS